MNRAQCTAPLWVILLQLLSGQPSPLAAKRVVHIPAPFTSHTRYHTKVARALHELGHQVMVAVPGYLLEKNVLDVSNFSVLHYVLNTNYEETVMNLSRSHYFSQTPVDFWSQVALFTQLCDEIMFESGLGEMVGDVQPDLIVMENVPHVYPLMVLPYKLGVPFAMLGTVYDVLSTRIPYSSAADPLQMGTFSDDMDFFERVKSMLMHLMFHVYHPFMRRNVVSTYAPEMPYISNHELLARPELWLVESDHILDYPRPTVPNVKLIGGTAAGPAKPLPKELQTFMDTSTQGVVIVSFGSYVLGVPKNLSDKLFQVFQNLPMNVVFRSNLTSPDPAKIFVSRWLPQNDLLGHPNTKLFVSHCGKNGQYEALFHAVPLFCTPMSAEQPYNSKRIQKKGFGEVVDLLTISPKLLLQQIVTVAQDPGYKRAISKASSLFRQQYGVPMQEAAKWLDHVMQYGGDYMRYAGQKMPLYQSIQFNSILFI
ncbi:hypothetical protein ACOMHN_023194 [Nucella lapillus]